MSLGVPEAQGARPTMRPTGAVSPSFVSGAISSSAEAPKKKKKKKVKKGKKAGTYAVCSIVCDGASFSDKKHCCNVSRMYVELSY